MRLPLTQLNEVVAMSKPFFDLALALEELEQEDLVSEEVQEELETEAEAAGDELEEVIGQVTTAEDVVESLEALVATMESALATGEGFTKREYAIAHDYSGWLLKRLGVKPVSVCSFESLSNDPKENLENLRLTVESLSDVAGKVKVAIVSMYQGIISKFKEWAGKVNAAAKAALAKLKKTEADVAKQDWNPFASKKLVVTVPAGVAKVLGDKANSLPTCSEKLALLVKGVFDPKNNGCVIKWFLHDMENAANGKLNFGYGFIPDHETNALPGGPTLAMGDDGVMSFEVGAVDASKAPATIEMTKKIVQKLLEKQRYVLSCLESFTAAGGFLDREFAGFEAKIKTLSIGLADDKKAEADKIIKQVIKTFNSMLVSYRKLAPYCVGVSDAIHDIAKAASDQVAKAKAE